MASGTVRYDEEKNTIYVTSGDTHLGDELDEFAEKWDALVVDNDMKDFSTIIDLSKLDPLAYIPVMKEEPPNWFGYESHSTRFRGDGKVVLVISRSKGGSPVFQEVWEPDAIVISIEEAEEFVSTGKLSIKNY